MFFDFLKRNPQVKKLDIYGSIDEFNGASNLANFLKTNNSLRHLKICNCNFLPNDMVQVLDALKCNDTLVSLDFSDGSSFDHRGHGIECVIHECSVLMDRNFSLVDMTPTFFSVSVSLERNQKIKRRVGQVIRFLIGIRQGNIRQGMGSLGLLPKEIVMMIAKELWRTRSDLIWRETEIEIHQEVEPSF